MRRSARKSLATPLIASMLRETEFAYAPNEALPRRRPSMFESPTPYTEDATASMQDDDDDNASTPTSITGRPAFVDVLDPACEHGHNNDHPTKPRTKQPLMILYVHQSLPAATDIDDQCRQRSYQGSKSGNVASLIC